MQRLPTTSTATTDTGLELAKWLGGAAAGALLMYMLDPERGSARRAHSASAVRSAGARTGSAIGNAWHEAGSRISAATDQAAEALKLDGGIGAAISHTIASARDALAPAADRAADGAVDLYEDARERASRLKEHLAPDVEDAGSWSPALRNTALVGGGALALLGLMRRSPLGGLIGLAGVALLARSAANQPLRTLVGRGAERLGLDQDLGRSLGMERTVDFEKTIHIEATPEQVYDLWTNYENFPHFMSHVSEVRDLGRRRSHWVVKGPGGTHFEWNSVLTEQNRPNRLAWRSEPGAEIPQSGSVQFERHRGGTLVTVRMSYTPPAGAIGHGLALLLGSDPKSRMDQDLARMRDFIERGAAPREAAQPGWASRFLH